MNSKSRWLMALGASLALAPSLTILGIAALNSEEPVAPYIQYLIVGTVALTIGYFLMRKSIEEQERERIRALIREVVKEPEFQDRWSLPPKSSQTELTAIEGGKLASSA